MAACLRGAEWEDVSDNAVSLVKWLLEVDPAKRCPGVVQNEMAVLVAPCLTITRSAGRV